jgi:hypothetical protein
LLTARGLSTGEEMNEKLVRAELRFLRGYAVLMSVLAGVFLLGVAQSRTHGSFGTIDVQRINVLDASGKIRLALFGKDDEPPDRVGGKDYDVRSGGGHSDAGLMFHNDEGDELGGLVYGGRKGPAGAIVQGQSLTFDAYQQDQVVQLMHEQGGMDRTAGLVVSDRPAISLVRTIPMVMRAERLPANERKAAMTKLVQDGYVGHGRLFAGLNHHDASLDLKDAQGRTRLRLSVAHDGTQKIEFLDAAGKVVRTIGPAD